MQTTDCYGCNPKPEGNLVACSNCHKVIRVTSDGKHAKYTDKFALVYTKDSSGRLKCESSELTDIHTCPYCFERDIAVRPAVNSDAQQRGQSSSNKSSSSSSWWGESKGKKEKKGWW